MTDVENMDPSQLREFAEDMVKDKRSLEQEHRRLKSELDKERGRLFELEQEYRTVSSTNRTMEVDNKNLRERLIDKSLGLGLFIGISSGLLCGIIVMWRLL